MTVDERIVRKCRAKLVSLAKGGRRITYGDLARHLHVANQSLGRYLNPIYEEEMEAKRPDLTVIPHYQDSWYGKFNSRGLEPQTIVVDPENRNHVRAYKAELRQLFERWGGKPKDELKRWLYD